MAVEADDLRLLRADNDWRREQLGLEADILRLEVNHEALMQQLHDERAQHDAQITRLREDHATMVSTLHEGKCFDHALH